MCQVLFTKRRMLLIQEESRIHRCVWKRLRRSRNCPSRGRLMLCRTHQRVDQLGLRPVGLGPSPRIMPSTRSDAGLWFGHSSNLVQNGTTIVPHSLAAAKGARTSGDPRRVGFPASGVRYFLLDCTELRSQQIAAMSRRLFIEYIWMREIRKKPICAEVCRISRRH